MKRYLSLCWIALTGCAVYVPTVPSTPLVNQKGDVEIIGAIRGLTSFEGNVAYSPLPHVVMVGEVASQSSQGSETRNNETIHYRNKHRQAVLGLGTYRMIGKEKSTYFGALAGIGFAHADIYATNISLFVLDPLVHYQASYRRYYGQAYISRQSADRNYGISLRNTFVDYRQLRRDNQPIRSVNHFFLEPTCFMRIGQGAVQGLGTLGFSIPWQIEPQKPDRRLITPTTLLVSAGLVVRPHLLWKRTQSERPE